MDEGNNEVKINFVNFIDAISIRGETFVCLHKKSISLVKANELVALQIVLIFLGS